MRSRKDSNLALESKVYKVWKNHIHTPTGLLENIRMTIRQVETRLEEEEFVPVMEQQFQGSMIAEVAGGDEMEGK